MRVATPDPLVSAIGDRAAASKLGRAAVTHRRPPITFHPGASMRRRPRRSSNRSESRPNQVMQALSERYRPLIGDRCRRDAVAWAPSSRGGRRRVGPRSRIASGKSKSAIIGDRDLREVLRGDRVGSRRPAARCPAELTSDIGNGERSWPAPEGHRTADAVRAGIESRKKTKYSGLPRAVSSEIDVTRCCCPGCRHREAAADRFLPDLTSHRGKSSAERRNYLPGVARLLRGRCVGLALDVRL